MRPSDVDPHFFVDEGEDTRSVIGLPTIVGALSALNFDRGGPWDTHRVGSNRQFVGLFTDFANVAIGLYGAAARIPQWMMLFVADQKAQSSNYGGVPTFAGYSHLSARDGADISLGYSLFNTHAIGRTPTY